MWELYLAKVQVAGVIMAAIITALGTLIAGGAAVCGALRVGMKQADISKELATAATNQTEIQRQQALILDEQNKILAQQTQILAGQLDIESGRARAELYEARMEVFDATRDWLNDFLTRGSRTGANFGEHDDMKRFPIGNVRDHYLRCIEKAIFLFDPSVSDRLQHLREIAAQHDFHIDHIMNDANGAHGDGAHRIVVEINTALMNITDIFRAEMTLHPHGANENRPQVQAS